MSLKNNIFGLYTQGECLRLIIAHQQGKRMYTFMKNLRNKLPYIGSLHRKIEDQGKFLAGHYSSPIPDKNEALSYLYKRKGRNSELPDINLNMDSQYMLLNGYAKFYEELPFPEKPHHDYRYYFDNPWFT
jgi:hypothetical protein